MRTERREPRKTIGRNEEEEEEVGEKEEREKISVTPPQPNSPPLATS